MRLLIVCVISSLVVHGCTENTMTLDVNPESQAITSKDTTAVYAAIRDNFNEQADCWNRADVDCFMQHYWKSEDLRFIGKSGVTYGWQPVRDRYKEHYPNKEAMGELAFGIKSMEDISDETVMTVGSWELTKSDTTVGGYFSLLWKEINGKWVIILDHTS